MADAQTATSDQVELEEGQEINRREFLNYAWLASLGIFMAELTGVGYVFALPRFRAGEFGGTFELGTASQALPDIDAPPIPYPEGKFWLVQTQQGVMALYKVCTHLGCIFDWVQINRRFECPCHGSKFEKGGDYIEGPAPRDLDRFIVRAVDAQGNVVAETSSEGKPLPLPNENVRLEVDTGERISGEQHV